MELHHEKTEGLKIGVKKNHECLIYISMIRTDAVFRFCVEGPSGCIKWLIKNFFFWFGPTNATFLKFTLWCLQV